MKKILSFVLALSMLMSLFSISGMARAEQQNPGLLEAVARESGASVGDPYLPAETNRQQINFNREWKFKSQKVTDDSAPDFGGATGASFDDSSWTNVGLPHSFSIPYNMETNFFVGYGLYRKTFNVPQEWLENGKRVSIEFEGAFIETEVFVNGEASGTHLGGYTGFIFDITDKLHAGENVIAVRVNNKWNPEQTPRTGDHHFSGGIYRDVYLNVTDSVHVAWYGTTVTTPALNNPGFDEKNKDGTLYHDYENIDETSYTPAEEVRENIAQKRSDVRVQTEVQNDSEAAKTVVVKQEVVDKADGTLVASFQSEPAVVAAHSTQVVDVKSDYIRNIKLWSPDEPNLYEVHTTIFGGNGEALDSYTSPLGFRWAQFLNDGFYLNGEKTVLFGANAHQDHAGWGDAVTNEALVRDVQMIKDAGMNFIRGSHYPHDPAYSEACDEKGVMLWSEVALWGMGGGNDREPTYTAADWNGVNGYPSNPDHYEKFDQSCLLGLEEMIRIHRNHPSVIIWSMGNELFFPMGRSDMQKRKDLVNQMRNLAHLLDPTRKAGMGGAQREEFDSLDVCDVAGYNGDGGSAALPEPGKGMPGHMTEYMPSIASEYGSHTANRGDPDDQFRPYFDHMQDGRDIYNYALKGNRAGLSLWCAFHHGSVGGSGLSQMGFIDYSRLPLKSWYWFREKYTGVPAEFSKEGTGNHLELSLSQADIPNDGTADTHLIVTVKDQNGDWVNDSPTVTLEVIDGPGVFPTGKVMTLNSGNLMRDGKGATEFRSYYSGTTVIEATAPGMYPVQVTVTTVETEPENGETEPDNFLVEEKGDASDTLPDAGAYTADKTGHPVFPSSGNGAMANDGDPSTKWVAETAGPGQYWMQDTEYALHMYKLKLDFDGEPYPYTVEVSNSNTGPWTEVVSYTADTIGSRPYEEDLGGIRARYVKVSFPEVPGDGHAFLNEATIYGITAQGAADETAPFGYTTDSVYLSDLQPVKPITQGWAGKTPGIDRSIEGNPIKIGGVIYDKGLGLHADSEAVYNLAGSYARFQAVIGIDDEASGKGDAIYRVYATVPENGADKEILLYERQISGSANELVDLSVRGATQLRLVTDANGANSNDHTDWADAKLLGAMRDMTKTDPALSVTMSSSTQGLEPGKTFETYVSLKNKAASRAYAASLALYDSEGNLVDLTVQEGRTARKGTQAFTIKLSVPTDAQAGYEARLNVYDPNTLMLLANTVHFGMKTQDAQPVRMAASFARVADGDSLVKVDGEDASVARKGGWGLWKDNSAYLGTETFVEKNNWQDSSIGLTFTGMQVIVGGKIDGSQVGADVYLDGEKIGHINSNSSANDGKNGYYEVWRSGVLTYEEHTLELIPTGKFSVDYFSYLTESPWVDVDGEDEAAVKEGTWGLWKDGKAYMGTETFVGDSYAWQNTAISLTFTGIQAAVGAKVDGSQVGAKVYLDGNLIKTVSTTEPDITKQGYQQVWVSPVLTEGEHILRLEPIGKFGFDYFSYLKPGFEEFIQKEDANKQALLKQIAEAKSLAQDAYTADTWEEMQKALKNAEAVRDQESPTQEQIDAAAEALKNAIAALVPYEAPSDAVRYAFAQSLAAVLRLVESDTAAQYEAAGIKALTADFRSSYALFTAQKPDADAFTAATALLLADLDALQKTEPDQKEYTLDVSFPVKNAQLSFEDTDIGFANLTGRYSAKVLSGTTFALCFTPTAEGREFAAVTLNGQPEALKASDSFTYTAEMPNADMALSFSFTVVSKQVLRATVKIAETLKGGEEYNAAVPAVQEQFDTALKNAVSVEADLTATQEEIDSAWSALLDSIHLLRFAKGDKAPLKDLLELAALLDGADYTAATWEAFGTALDSAQTVYLYENALEPDIQDAVENLKNAMETLQYKANLETLNQLIEKATAIKALLAEEYLPDGQEAFLAALDAAQSLGGDTDQAAIDQAANELSDAMAALRRIPSKKALEALLQELQAIGPQGYTTASYAAFRSQINLMLAVYDNENATEEEIAQACERGAMARALLENSPSTPDQPAKKAGKVPYGRNNSYGAAGIVSASVSPVITAAQNISTGTYVRSDTTGNLSLKKGASYCFKMTVVNGDTAPLFTVGNGGVLKTQFVARAGNDYYYRVYAIGTPGESTGVYTAFPNGAPQRHCVISIS